MAGGGGAWKVAYADFVTAMMAFFLVMWITGQSKEVKQAIARHFNGPFHPVGQTGTGGTTHLPLSGAGAMSKSSAAAAKKDKDKDKDKDKELPRGGRFRNDGSAPPPTPDPDAPEGRKPHVLRLHDSQRSAVGAVILFDEHSVELREDSKEQLRHLAPLMLGKPNKIEIRGHTTRRRLPAESPFEDAWQLSYARCLATMRFLEQAGIDPQRIRMSQAGGFEPYTIRLEPERQARNSRVEIFMLDEFVEHLVGTHEERSERSALQN